MMGAMTLLGTDYTEVCTFWRDLRSGIQSVEWGNILCFETLLRK